VQKTPTHTHTQIGLKAFVKVLGKCCAAKYATKHTFISSIFPEYKQNTPTSTPQREKLTQHDSDFNTWKTTNRPNQRNRPIPNFFHSTLVIHHRPKSKGRGWRVKLFKVFPTR